MKVTVDSTDYRNTHGHSPKGNGKWIFYRWLNQRIHHLIPLDIVAAMGPMNYSEAKAYAVDEARHLGISEIFVGS
jgi:hypothetical protein